LPVLWKGLSRTSSSTDDFFGNPGALKAGECRHHRRGLVGTRTGWRRRFSEPSPEFETNRRLLFATVNSDATVDALLFITAAKACEPARIDYTTHEGYNPRDRRDYNAPPGIKAIRCGSTRVMGSANYFVPDACGAATQVDSDNMGGISAHALWSVSGGLLVLGVKTPGSHIPMLGLWSKGQLAWKVEVPEGNPLDCDLGGTRPTTLIEDRVITTYTNKKTGVSTLTSFTVASGTRLWSTGFPKEVGRPLRLTVESGQLWVEVDGSSTKDSILVFDAKAGKFRFGVTSGSANVFTSLVNAP
jgi:hypothetical protein